MPRGKRNKRLASNIEDSETVEKKAKIEEDNEDVNDGQEEKSHGQNEDNKEDDGNEGEDDNEDADNDDEEEDNDDDEDEEEEDDDDEDEEEEDDDDDDDDDDEEEDVRCCVCGTDNDALIEEQCVQCNSDVCEMCIEWEDDQCVCRNCHESPNRPRCFCCKNTSNNLKECDGCGERSCSACFEHCSRYNLERWHCYECYKEYAR